MCTDALIDVYQCSSGIGVTSVYRSESSLDNSGAVDLTVPLRNMAVEDR